MSTNATNIAELAAVASLAVGNLYTAVMDVAERRLSAAIEAGSSEEFIHWTTPILPSDRSRRLDAAYVEYFARRDLVSDLYSATTVVERILQEDRDREDRVLQEDRDREDRDREYL